MFLPMSLSSLSILKTLILTTFTGWGRGSVGSISLNAPTIKTLYVCKPYDLLGHLLLLVKDVRRNHTAKRIK